MQQDQQRAEMRQQLEYGNLLRQIDEQFLRARRDIGLQEPVIRGEPMQQPIRENVRTISPRKIKEAEPENIYEEEEPEYQKKTVDISPENIRALQKAAESFQMR